METKSIGIIGNGVVGDTVAKVFAPIVQVRTFDTMPDRATHTLLDTIRTDLVFICLPTPRGCDGQCDTSLIENAVDMILRTVFRQTAQQIPLVIRSTVPVGFTNWLAHSWGLYNVVYSPEFLTERTALHDAGNPTQLIVGTAKSINGLSANVAERRLMELYQARFPGLAASGRVVKTTAPTAEMVKNMQNAFSAVKIAFFNEMWELAQANYADWPKALELLLANGWVNPMHTQVPGPDGKYGFGGKCLPKDLASVVYQINRYGTPYVTKAALQRNERRDRIK